MTRRRKVTRRQKGGNVGLSALLKTYAAKKTRRRRITQKWGAHVCRKKPRLVDKIAKGASMFLSGPAPSFPGVGVKLACQAFKGIKDNVHYYRRRR